MNFEFFRRETAKKNMGLTELPTEGKSVTIAKGLEPVDFIGMIMPGNSEISTVSQVDFMRDEETGEIDHYDFGGMYHYDPNTGILSCSF